MRRGGRWLQLCLGLVFHRDNNMLRLFKRYRVPQFAGHIREEATLAVAQVFKLFESVQDAVLRGWEK